MRAIRSKDYLVTVSAKFTVLISDVSIDNAYERAKTIPIEEMDLVEMDIEEIEQD